MTKIEFKGELSIPKKENLLKQGDFVYCQACYGAHSFWGIVNQGRGVISLDGGGGEAVKGKELYLGETYNYWTIVKRIPCDKMKITLEEIN